MGYAHGNNWGFYLFLIGSMYYVFLFLLISICYTMAKTTFSSFRNIHLGWRRTLLITTILWILSAAILAFRF